MSEVEEKEYTVEQAFIELKNEAYLKGMHLLERPFDPCEIDFVQSFVTDANESIKAIVYSRDGYNISRPINSENQWSLLHPDYSIAIKVEINSLYEGLIILSSMGVKDVHPFEFVKKSLETEIF
jgi:hypothetical protein